MDFNTDDSGGFNEEEEEETLEEEENEMLDDDVVANAGVAVGVLNDEMQEVLMGLSSRSEDALSAALSRMRRILVSDNGGKMLQQYVLASPKCVELTTAWAAGPRARTAVPLLLLLSEIFRMGLKIKSENEVKDVDEHRRMLAVQLRLDKLALSIVQTKLSDVYSHLSSGQRSRENGALRLMSAIVLRGRLLAKQVASKFDFALEALRKLAKHPPRGRGFPVSGDVLKVPTRVAFIEFALSFLVVGDAGLLRWILQKRVLYAGLLHGLASDDDDTVVRVLAIMKRRVLHSAGSVPQGIQCALFGDAALEQLARITAWPVSSEAVELAQDVLLSLCTDPAHGICPSGSSWETFQKRSGQYGGGAGRLLRLMLRLKATEVDLHKDLLLAIAKTRPLLAAAYIDSFPYSLEPRVSVAWFSAMSLISSLVSIGSVPDPFDSISAQGLPPPSGDSSLVQSCLRRIWPQSLSRALFNRGLLHEDHLVKHSCLRLLLEVLGALECLLQFIKNAEESCVLQYKEDWINLRSYVQDRARMVSPDCHTLLSVHFSSRKASEEETIPVGSKRKGLGREDDQDGRKRKLKPDSVGLDYQPVNTDETKAKLIDIWGQDLLSGPDENMETLLHAKLLQVFTLYQKALPLALRDINFDPFKFVPEDVKRLSLCQQQSLLSLLLSTMRHASSKVEDTTLATCSIPLYKNLKLLMKLMVNSKTADIRQQAHLLLQGALYSTGAFESNPYEIAIWLHLLPGWHNGRASDETVATFLCDVVVSVGKNMYKYMDELHSLLSKHSLEGIEIPVQGATAYEFGPLAVCALDTYMRLASPEAKSLKIPQRAAVSVYLVSVLHSLLSFQAYPHCLAILITSKLSLEDSELNGCEWNALKNLYSHAGAILERKTPSYWSLIKENPPLGNLQELLEACQQEDSVLRSGKAFALARSLYCVHPLEFVENFFRLLEVHEIIFEGDYSVITSLLGAYPELLSEIASAAPTIFSEAMSTISASSTQKESISAQGNSMTMQIPEGFTDKSSALLCTLLGMCSFSTLFLAACSYNGGLLTLPHMVDVLMRVLEHLPDADIMVAARLILHRLNSLHTLHQKDLDTQRQLDACFVLLKGLVVSSGRPDSSVMRQLVKDVLCHPLISKYFLSKEKQVRKLSFWDVCKSTDLDGLRQTINSLLDGIDSLDRHVLQILEGLLKSEAGRSDSRRFVHDYCRPLIQRALETFHAEMQQDFNSHSEVVPSASLLAISVLGPYAQLDPLIAFVQILSREVLDQSKSCGSSRSILSYHLIWFYLASLALEKVQDVFHDVNGKQYWFDKGDWYADKLIDIYNAVLHLKMVSSLEISNSCMLKAMQILVSTRSLTAGHVAITPIELLPYCMQGTDKIKSEVAFLLVRESPTFLSEFGRLVATLGSGTFQRRTTDLSKVFLSNTKFQVRTEGLGISENDLMLLLPAVTLFLTYYDNLEGLSNRETALQVSMVYSDLLMKYLIDWDVNVGNWTGYVKERVEGKDCYEYSLLSNIVKVLRLSLALRPPSTKQKRRLFRSLLPKSSKLLDPCVEDAKSFESAAFPILVNRIVGKASVLEVLLLDHQVKEDDSSNTATFVAACISTLAAVYKRAFSDGTRDTANEKGVLFLEERLLESLCDAVDGLMDMNPSCVYTSIRTMAKTILRYRFGEIVPMRALQRVFVMLLKSLKVEDLLTIQKLATDVMDFVIGHSQFLPFLLSKRHVFTGVKGTVLTELPSLLSLLGIPSDWENGGRNREDVHDTAMAPSSYQCVEQQRISLLKLLRVLYAFRIRYSDHLREVENKMTSGELLSLLLAAYGATLSAADQELFYLMHEIEVAEGAGFSGMSGMDYLWGDAALERRKEKAELDTSSDGEELLRESREEIRKRRFKEDLALDPRRCGMTVLHFPMKRDLWLSDFETTDLRGLDEYATAECLNDPGSGTYDPAFIIPFAMHALSVGCIDAEEFVRSGLLGIAFSSTSSAFEGLRKSGYELLSKYMSILEGGPSFKGKSQIVTLLMYIKNAITEPWQRIPSVISLFAAEAACILMHPENSLYMTVNRFLLRSPSIDLESIPLFQTMFSSGNVTARSERAWMFRLLLAGLVSSSDAHIYRRQFVAEISMSFCTSSMADGFAQRWVLQILKRAAAIPSFAESLMDNTGLISWLASIAINTGQAMVIQASKTDYQDATTALQVIDFLLSKKRTETHLLAEGTEELSKVALTLHQFLSSSVKTSKQWEVFSRPSIQILKSAFKFSQKRRRYQSSFRLSLKSLHETIQWVEIEIPGSCNEVAYRETRCSALECLLHCPPPPVSRNQDQDLICSIARWATLVLSESDPKEHRASSSERTESISGILLRWCSAALLLGNLPQGDGEVQKLTTWWSFFSYLNKYVQVHSSKLQLSRLLISLSTMNSEAGKSEVIATVNALLVLLSGIQSSPGNLKEGDKCDLNSASHWLPGEIHDMLRILLSEIPCPQELNPSWHWSFYRPWSRQEVDLYEYEVYRVLLAVLQQFYSVPSGQIPALVAKWRSALSSGIERGASEDSEVSCRLGNLHRKLCKAMSVLIQK